MVGTNQQPLLVEVADATLKFWIYQFQSKSCIPLWWICEFLFMIRLLHTQTVV